MAYLYNPNDSKHKTDLCEGEGVVVARVHTFRGGSGPPLQQIL